MAAGDQKLVYAAWVNITFTSLNSLASSSTLLAGAESEAVANGANLYLDAIVAGVVEQVAGTPTAGIIEVRLFGEIGTTPIYPDVLDGTDSAETFATLALKNAATRLVRSIPTDATARAYPVGPFSVTSFFGGLLPRNWGLFVTHNTVNALHATASAFRYQGVYSNVAS